MSELTIPAISLWQPHASLFFLPDASRKIYETRSWPVPKGYRGPIAIHAAKTMKGWHDFGLTGREAPSRLPEPWRSSVSLMPIFRLSELPYGAILGVCDLAACVSTPGFPPLPYPARVFGDFGPGRYAWRMDNPRSLSKPVPFTGRQGMFRVPVSLLEGLV